MGPIRRQRRLDKLFFPACTDTASTAGHRTVPTHKRNQACRYQQASSSGPVTGHITKTHAPVSGSARLHAPTRSANSDAQHATLNLVVASWTIGAARTAVAIAWPKEQASSTLAQRARIARTWHALHRLLRLGVRKADSPRLQPTLQLFLCVCLTLMSDSPRCTTSRSWHPPWAVLSSALGNLPAKFAQAHCNRLPLP